MPVLNRLRIRPRQGTRRWASMAPTGSPKQVATSKAVPETWSDKKMICHS